MATTRQLRQQKKDFLDSFRQTGNVSYSAVAAGVHRATVYRWLDKDKTFAAAFRDAEMEAVDTMEHEAWRRAVKGTEKPVYQGGVKVGTVREYSDTLMIFLLKARDPARFREKHQHEHTGPDGAPLVFTMQIDRRDDDGDDDPAN